MLRQVCDVGLPTGFRLQRETNCTCEKNLSRQQQLSVNTRRCAFVSPLLTLCCRAQLSHSEHVCNRTLDFPVVSDCASACVCLLRFSVLLPDILGHLRHLMCVSHDPRWLHLVVAAESLFFLVVITVHVRTLFLGASSKIEMVIFQSGSLERKWRRHKR